VAITTNIPQAQHAQQGKHRNSLRNKSVLASQYMPKPEGIHSPSFCRISEFGSINRREFATPIVARRQNIASKTNVFLLRITCFLSGGNYKFPIFLSAKLQIRRNNVPSVASEQSSNDKFGETKSLRRGGKLIKTENVTSNKIIKE